MSIIIAFCAGIAFMTLADSIADYISAKAIKIRAEAEAIGVQNKIKELKAEKRESTDE